VHSPAVLILDEPTVGLDPLQIREIRALIAELAAAGQGEDRHAVILSTHILAEVEAICRRVILIHEGRKVVDAPLAELTSGGRSLDEIFVRETTRDSSRAPEGAE
jgi:ABC-2 type transport system ATP-binding protein